MTDLKTVEATPTGMRLTDWVAAEEGFFEDEGLDVRVNWDVLHRQQAPQGTTADQDYENTADLRLAKFFAASELTSACAWGGICMAGAGVGRFVKNVHGVSPMGIFVPADSPIEAPEDLADVPIAVGLRAGSHFSTMHHLERHLPLDKIKVENHGGFGARLTALVEGRVRAACLLPPQVYMAKELGFRSILEGDFKTTWWVTDKIGDDRLEPYIRAILRAEAALDENLEKYLPLWKYSVPPEFSERDWDFAKFGRGERLIDAPYSEAEFDELLAQAARWGLDNHMTERSFAALAHEMA